MGTLFDPGFVIESFPSIIKYLPVTIEISIISMLLGLLIGFIVALIKIYNVPILNKIASLYVTFIRGTPLLVQLYLSYYGIPLVLQYINYTQGTNININNIPAILFVFFAFSMNEGAYTSETIRAAIQSVDKGQYEAAASIGMTNLQTMTRIVIPEAFIVALPNMGNSFISLIKGTSLAFTISVMDIMASGKIIAARAMRFFEVYIVIAIIYCTLTILVEKVVKYLEGKVSIEGEIAQNDRG